MTRKERSGDLAGCVSGGSFSISLVAGKIDLIDLTATANMK
jgi:hypothetical protein